MDDRIKQLMAAVTSSDDELAFALAGDVKWLSQVSDDELHELLTGIATALDSRKYVNEKLLGAMLRQVVVRSHRAIENDWKQLSANTREATVTLYQRLGASSQSRHLLLQLLSVSRGPMDLLEFAELVVTDSPSDPTSAAVSFGPLLQHRDYDPNALFPRLLDALGQPAIAPLVMDLANFVTREELVESHPAADRREELATLLGALVQRLGIIEERPYEVSEDDRVLSSLVSQSVSLSVSLCDALGLIGDAESIGKLNQVLQLRHRRLRTEAAAALAKLGDDNGQQVLVSLAAEPIARLRVLAYADELGLEDKIDEKYSTPEARAEAELALWLAEPAQLGFPPSRLEMVDSKTLYWPGFDEPVDCFLFRFAYEVGESEYSNIGIAGPLCHAFAADLADLPPADIYSVFAGWQAEHEEIYEVDVNQLTQSQRVDVSRFERRLMDDGYVDIHPITLGFFMGDKALIARAVRDGQLGIAVATLDDVQWHSIQNRRRPLGAHEAWCMFKGRRLLRAFNEG
jgi:hypothetical protein